MTHFTPLENFSPTHYISVFKGLSAWGECWRVTRTSRCSAILWCQSVMWAWLGIWDCKVKHPHNWPIFLLFTNQAILCHKYPGQDHAYLICLAINLLSLVTKMLYMNMFMNILSLDIFNMSFVYLHALPISVPHSAVCNTSWLDVLHNFFVLFLISCKMLQHTSFIRVLKSDS